MITRYYKALVRPETYSFFNIHDKSVKSPLQKKLNQDMTFFSKDTVHFQNS